MFLMSRLHPSIKLCQILPIANTILIGQYNDDDDVAVIALWLDGWLGLVGGGWCVCGHLFL